MKANERKRLKVSWNEGRFFFPAYAFKATKYPRYHRYQTRTSNYHCYHWWWLLVFTGLYHQVTSQIIYHTNPPHNNAWHHITSHDVILQIYDMTTHHITSHHNAWHHITSSQEKTSTITLYLVDWLSVRLTDRMIPTSSNETLLIITATTAVTITNGTTTLPLPCYYPAPTTAITTTAITITLLVPYRYPLILILAEDLRKVVLLVPPRPVAALVVAATERWVNK